MFGFNVSSMFFLLFYINPIFSEKSFMSPLLVCLNACCSNKLPNHSLFSINRNKKLTVV